MTVYIIVQAEHVDGYTTADTTPTVSGCHRWYKTKMDALKDLIDVINTKSHEWAKADGFPETDDPEDHGIYHSINEDGGYISDDDDRDFIDYRIRPIIIENVKELTKCANCPLD